MSTYRAEQEIAMTGWGCGTEIDLKMVVTYGMTKHYPSSNDGPEELPQPEDIVIRLFRKHEKVAVEIAVPPFIEDAFLESDEFKSWLTSEAGETELAAADDAADQKRDASPSQSSNEGK
jgi:hypothetical protein